MLSLSWCESHLILPLGILLSVGAVAIILFKNKEDFSFIHKMGSKVKGCVPSTEGQWKFVIPYSSHHFVPTHPSLPWLGSGSNWIDVKSALRQICCLKHCLDFLWRLTNFIQVVGSPSCIFHAIVPDEIKNNPLEYMEVQIPKGVDHLRGSPTKTLH